MSFNEDNLKAALQQLANNQQVAVSLDDVAYKIVLAKMHNTPENELSRLEAPFNRVLEAAEEVVPGLRSLLSPDWQLAAMEIARSRMLPIKKS